MVLGVLAAPVLLNGRSPETVVRLSTGLLVVGAGIAAIGLVRRIATDEALDVKAAGAEPGSVGHAVSAFELSDGDHEPVPVAELATSGAVALVVLGRSEDRERESMVRELADGLRDSPFPLVVVAEGSAIAQRLAASRTARVLQDPSGAAHRALGIPVRGLRRRSRGGVFVIDAGLVVRFAFVPTEDDQWIPASFVLGRMARMTPAAPPEVELLRTDLRSPAAGPAPASDSL
jgi:hypothetical protein